MRKCPNCKTDVYHADKHCYICDYKLEPKPARRAEEDSRSSSGYANDRATIERVAQELSQLAKIGKWSEDSQWDMREYFKMAKLNSHIGLISHAVTDKRL